uniref:Nucleoside-diphosphate kinase n=1 Tax=Strongyloides venezuelensis TaxID=75913 RepID=A0A0K0G067_STRVS
MPFKMILFVILGDPIRTIESKAFANIGVSFCCKPYAGIIFEKTETGRIFGKTETGIEESHDESAGKTIMLAV